MSLIDDTKEILAELIAFPTVSTDSNLHMIQWLAQRLGDLTPKRDWLVSVAMPIEAAGPADAVRQFWSYVRDLGPAELPAFVWPSGRELAMQAFLLGAEANQDPEEDED